VTYRDLGADPIPHLDSNGGLARLVPPDQHTAAQAASWELSRQLVAEIERAHTILLGLPLYNFGAPSTVKAWVDHIVANGLSINPETQEGLLGGRELIVIAARGGGYAPGTSPRRLGPRRTLAPPRRRLDRPGAALHHGRTHARGGQPRHVRVDPTGTRNRANAERAIDQLWQEATRAA
jgi:FMN-dependent NADH-azoreductase